MKILNYSPVLAIAASAALLQNTQAALTAYESFSGYNVSPSPIAGQTVTGSGFTSSSTYANQQGTLTAVSSGSLNYGGSLVPSQGDKLSFPGGGNQGVVAQLNTTYGTAGTTIYLSFLVSYAGPTNSYMGVNLFSGNTGGSTGSSVAYIGKGSNNVNWGLENVAASQYSDTAATATTTLLVLKIDFGATSTLSLFVDPDLGQGEPTTADAVATRVGLNFNAIRFVSGGAGSIDEFRMGTTFADVAPIPEPSIAGLAGGSLAFVCLARRKRNRA